MVVQKIQGSPLEGEPEKELPNFSSEALFTTIRWDSPIEGAVHLSNIRCPSLNDVADVRH